MLIGRMKWNCATVECRLI